MSSTIRGVNPLWLAAGLDGRRVCIACPYNLPAAGVQCRTSCRPVARRQLGNIHLAVQRQRSPRSTMLSRVRALKEDQAAARSRLQGLLDKVDQDDEDVALLEAYEEAPPGLKLLLALGSGATVTAVAFLLCSLSHSDPLGGLRLLSPDTWYAAGVGLAVGAPWALLRGLAWTGWAQQMFPVLGAVKEAELRSLEPVISSLTLPQVAAVAAVDCVPEVLLLLPAAQGGLTLSFGVYASMLRSQMLGLTDLLPIAQLPSLLAILMTASLCSWVHYNSYATSGEEYEVVESAIRSADRYYRVLSMQPQAQPNSAERMSSTFKSVATAWVKQHRAAGVFLAASKAVDIVGLCLLWRATGNLAAPLIAALLTRCSDVAAVYQQLDSEGTTTLQQ